MTMEWILKVAWPVQGLSRPEVMLTPVLTYLLYCDTRMDCSYLYP